MNFKKLKKNYVRFGMVSILFGVFLISASVQIARADERSDFMKSLKDQIEEKSNETISDLNLKLESLSGAELPAAEVPSMRVSFDQYFRSVNPSVFHCTEFLFAKLNAMPQPPSMDDRKRDIQIFLDQMYKTFFDPAVILAQLMEARQWGMEATQSIDLINRALGLKKCCTEKEDVDNRISDLENYEGDIDSVSDAPAVQTAALVPAPAKKSKSKLETRCYQCNAKLGGFGGVECLCGHSFCSYHLQDPERRHNCPVDRRALQRARLTKKNPVIQGPDKVPNRNFN